MPCRSMRFAVAVALSVAAAVAHADTPSILTLNYPTLPPPGVPDTDGYLNPAAQTFQEGGMHVEQFWVKNNQLTFSADAHFHIKYPNPYEISHGFGNMAGLGPDRTGIYLRREDGGPFSLLSLDYRLVQPSATNLMIGTAYDPSQPITSQLTPFPIVADPNFQVLAPSGFANVTQLFLGWDLGESIDDTAQIDNIVVSFPTGTCSQSVPGGIVAAHAGHADPTTEGWTTEGAANGVAVGPVTDLGIDAWTVDDDSSGAGSSRTYAYFPPPDVMCWARTSGFRVRGKVRVVDLPDTVDGAVLVSFSDSSQVFELRLGQTGTGRPIVWLSNSSVTLSTLDDGFHVYELVYDPATATVDLIVDGTEVLSNRPGLAQNVAAPRVRFGSAYDFGTGQAHYAFVDFVLPERCSNGVDDDGDGLIDYPADPGCSSASDHSETGACGNGLDDDGDGLADFPADPGCTSLDDDSERDPALVCDDGIDSDGDGLIDYPSDPGCAAPTDPTETAACENGLDDDGDELVDFPSDPGCASPTDDSEDSAAPACADGIDNDGDGLVDFPNDPGCASAVDDSENDPALACDDALDNDGDGLIDVAADPGCALPSGPMENPRCQDGLDNDGDGTIDFDGGASLNGGVPLAEADPQCSGKPARNSEAPSSGCGLGADLALVLSLVGALRRRWLRA